MERHFITVTCDGKHMRVNVDHILYFEASVEDRSYIKTTFDGGFLVKESPATVESLLQEAGAKFVLPR